MHSHSYTCAPDASSLDPSLAQHLRSELAQTAHYDAEREKYAFRRQGMMIYCGGLHAALRYRYYPHYKDNRSKRKRGTQVKGSNKAMGKRVDEELKRACAGVSGNRQSTYTRALLAYWTRTGHTLQACQVPVDLSDAAVDRMTQADVLTWHAASATLWLWEVKTGMPVGFHRKQGKMRNMPHAAAVDCTKLNIWHLQLHHTRAALQRAGVAIGGAAVIQVCERKGQGFDVKVHAPPAWTTHMQTAAAADFLPQRVCRVVEKDCSEPAPSSKKRLLSTEDD